MTLRLVLGGTGGIGAAFVDELRSSFPNDELWIASRRPEAMSSESNTRSFTLDYNDLDNAVELYESLQSQSTRLSQVIVATGLLHEKDLMPEKALRNYSAVQAERLMRINALGPIEFLSKLFSVLPRKTEVQVGFLSARVGSIADNGLGGWYSYRASKAALNMLIKTASIELQRTHPKAQLLALHPGTTDTQLSKPFQARVPDGKLFTPEFVAQRLLAVMHQVKGGASGQFLAWDGATLPW